MHVALSNRSVTSIFKSYVLDTKQRILVCNSSMPGNDAGVTPSEVYERSSKALESLSNVWNVSASVIKAITEVTDSSLRSEPDYQAVQHVKREHDQVVASLKTEFEWLEQHIPSSSDANDSASGEKQMRIDALQQEQEELRTVRDYPNMSFWLQ